LFAGKGEKTPSRLRMALPLGSEIRAKKDVYRRWSGLRKRMANREGGNLNDYARSTMTETGGER